MLEWVHGGDAVHGGGEAHLCLNGSRVLIPYMEGVGLTEDSRLVSRDSPYSL